LSITTGWPHASVNFWPSVRASKSDGPPAASGTTMRIVLDGKGDCADAACTTSIAALAAAKYATNRRRPARAALNQVFPT
jgi:hypothetical protein